MSASEVIAKPRNVKGRTGQRHEVGQEDEDPQLTPSLQYPFKEFTTICQLKYEIVFSFTFEPDKKCVTV